MKKIFIIIFISFIMLSYNVKINAYWGDVAVKDIDSLAAISIGDWDYTNNNFDHNRWYDVGDVFIADNKKWIVTDSWFNWKTDLINPDGTINYDNLIPYGNGINEVTNEYRKYNTYNVGDIIIYKGKYYKALNGGANHILPDSDIYIWELMQ